MRLPVDVIDLIKSGTQIEKERERPVRIALFVEPDAPDALVDAAQSAFRPYTASAHLQVEVAEPGVKLLVDPSVDVVVGLIGGAGPAIAGSLAAARERAIPTAAVAMAEDAVVVADALGHPYRDMIASADEIRAIHIELGEWLVERVSGKRLALAHNFEFMRRAVAVEHVKNTATQNALIGAVSIIPGADMPVMTANQAKMILQIAAAYGEQLGAHRARELIAVLGGAYLLRTAARQAVAFVPGFGWALKGGIAYSGTIAMGYAAIKFFEHGADLGDLEVRLKEYGAHVTERARSLSRKGPEGLAAETDVAQVRALPASGIETVAPEVGADVSVSAEPAPGE